MLCAAVYMHIQASFRLSLSSKAVDHHHPLRFRFAQGPGKGYSNSSSSTWYSSTMISYIRGVVDYLIQQYGGTVMSVLTAQ